MLNEIKNEYFHYYLDQLNHMQGEYKWWHDNGELRNHCFYKDDVHHGNSKWWYDSGELISSRFFTDGNDITDEVRALVEDFNNITDEERMMIKLKFGIECLC